MGNWFSRGGLSQRVVIQGLDCAGKTTLLYKMKLGTVVTTIPTIGFNVESIQVNGVDITCWDIGGRDKMRPLIRHYYQNTTGVIYVIDSNDRERLDTALDELISFVLEEDELRNSVVMLAANKQDMENAMSAQEIEEALKKKFTGIDSCSQTIFVWPCSVVKGEGLHEAFDFFTSQLRLRGTDNLKTGLKSQKDIEAELEERKENQQEGAYSRLKTLFKDPVGYFQSLFY